MDTKSALIALNRLSGIGPKRIQILEKNIDFLPSVFNQNQQTLEKWGLPSKLAHTIAHANLDNLEEEYRWEQQPNHHILTWHDAHYPTMLKQIDSAPPILYVKGNVECLQSSCIAMVGSRKPTIHGSENAWHFGNALGTSGLTVVSGLALGVDARAHQGCIAGNGQTIAVMATGIDRIYPARHRSLADQIEQNGAIITEFPLKTAPQARHFPQRNRIISGLALSTLVVEAAIRSGSLITAKYALEQNRDVLAIPGSINNPMSAGCHYLLQQGAKLVTHVQDIINEFNLTTYSNISTEANHNKVLTPSQKSLIHYLGFDVADVDLLYQRSGMKLDAIIRDLAYLEVIGIIKPVPGGYQRC